MSDNKFIERLKGKDTSKSVLEINNKATKTLFANMPSGTSNAIDVYSDHRGDATAVLNGTVNWKISNSSLILTNDVAGDGNDFSSTYSVSGTGLWIDSVYTFPSTGDPNHPVAMVFNPSTKWVLKVCGDNLIVDGGYIADFTLLVKIGTSNVFTKTFSVAEQAGQFCKEFILDFDETNAGIIKASGLSTLTVQLLCGTANASARIYNGMTVLTCLQRKVDASAVSTSFANVEEVLQDGMLPNDYFNNAAYIGEVEDGERAYAVFERDGDNMNLAGWDEPIPDQTGNSGKFLTTDGSDMSWYQITASDVGALPDSTKYGASFVLSMNSSTFVITAQLKDQDGNNLGSAQTIDLPLESVVVNGSYDNATKSLILTLENGNTITIPVGDLISGLQETLVSGTNIKTINGNSVLGAGDLQISGFLPYPAGWTTNSTTKAFCDDIAADSSAVVGNAYLGEVTISDMPAGIANGEIKVYILDGTNASNKVIQLELTSGNIAPYKWIYTYWNGGSDVSGWKTWQEPLVSGTNIKTVNSTSLLGSGDITIDGLPTQTGQGGKYLTTDGSTASWGTVDALPTQTGNSGKLLTTNGTSASWTEIKTINSGSLVGSGNIDVLVNEATATNALGVGYTTINTTYNDSINIGNGAQVLGNNAIALGAFASAEGQDSIAIYSSAGTAHRARTTHTGNIAIGYNALAINAAYTIAIGYNAYAQGTNSIQLGTGNVALQNTFQVWTYPMLNKTTGLIPSARLADQTNATQGQALILDANLDGQWTTIATVATSGSYNDLLNKPTIPAAQVNADWNANSGVAEILNKPTLGTMAAESASDYTPTASLAAVALSGAYSDLSGTPSLATVATSGDYDDLLNKPTIPTVNDATLTIQKNGTNVATFTANASSAVTANISVPTDTNDLTNGAGYITGITSSDVTTALGYTPYNSTNPNGYISGITSSDVTTALGYTPYSDANPNGYTSNVGTVTSVNNTSPDGSGNVSLTIPTVNNPTITITQGGVTKGSFTLNQASGDTIALDAGGGGSVDIDNLTITKNGDDELQAVATVNANTAVGATNPVYDWVGTLAEYEAQAVATNHPDWVCYITDDAEATAYQAYTQSQCNNLFVQKGHQVIDFQEPNAGNNYTWYRKYADGWVEQGGVVSGGTSQTITLPVVMADEYYSILLGNRSGTYEQIRVASQTATTLVLKNSNNSGTVSAYWQVSGMAA